MCHETQNKFSMCPHAPRVDSIHQGEVSARASSSGILGILEWCGANTDFFKLCIEFSIFSDDPLVLFSLSLAFSVNQKRCTMPMNHNQGLMFLAFIFFQIQLLLFLFIWKLNLFTDCSNKISTRNITFICGKCIQHKNKNE